MTRQRWIDYDEGSTVGKRGSEQGIILRDEQYRDAARITLERDGYTPFAITCGMFGWMVHTCFFSTMEEGESAFESIKTDLVELIQLIPDENDPEWNPKMRVLAEAMETFVKKILTVLVPITERNTNVGS